MNLKTNTCQVPNTHLIFNEVEPYATKLACLLIDTEEFQSYLRLERMISMDPQVSGLYEKISELQMSYLSSMDEEGNTLDSLNLQLEMLPVMVEYRQAESAVRELFNAVDRVVSQSAGIDFASNTRSVFT